MEADYQDFLIRDWRAQDRIAGAALICAVLAEYGLGWEPQGADQDVLAVEDFYLAREGEFWVVEQQGKLVGTGGYYPVPRSSTVEIRKMYLLPEVRGRGLGRFLLQILEQAIATQGFQEIRIETASVLVEAVKLYERSGYRAAREVETARCDRAYVKSLNQSG